MWNIVIISCGVPWSIQCMTAEPSAVTRIERLPSYLLPSAST